MMVGTVYVVTDDDVVERWIAHEDTDNEAEFIRRQAAFALREGMPPGSRLEFGPIGRPWSSWVSYSEPPCALLHTP